MIISELNVFMFPGYVTTIERQRFTRPEPKESVVMYCIMNRHYVTTENY